MGIGSWIGGVVKGVVTPVVGAVSKYKTERNEIAKAELQGQLEVTKAETEFKVAEFKAKADRVANTDQNTFDLDKMAMKEAAKTWWDEFLVLIYLFPFLYTMIFALMSGWGAGVMVEPSVIWAEINGLADWYKYGLALIGVRYLGFRNLLRKGMEMYAARKKA